MAFYGHCESLQRFVASSILQGDEEQGEDPLVGWGHVDEGQLEAKVGHVDALLRHEHHEQILPLALEGLLLVPGPGEGVRQHEEG